MHRKVKSSTFLSGYCCDFSCVLNTVFLLLSRTPAFKKDVRSSSRRWRLLWGHRSVVQFAYGEDGIDVTQRSFLREFGFLARNAERFAQQVDPAGAERASRLAGLNPLEQEALHRNRCRSMLIPTRTAESWS